MSDNNAPRILGYYKGLDGKYHIAFRPNEITNKVNEEEKKDEDMLRTDS
jgi:hypothetical protein